MKKIFYFPFSNDSNLYCERMQSILSRFGRISEIKKNKLILDALKFKRNDVLFLNWFENQIINKKGFVSYVNVVKILFYFILLRLIFRNFIFVRHNHYPHNCVRKDASKAIKIINFLEKIPHNVIVHSPTELKSENRYYIAHPLYSNSVERNHINYKSNSFVIFGRICRYKKIENVLRLFPDKMSLIIMGKSDDDEYLQELKEIIAGRNNIKIISEFVSDEKAKEIISNSQGLLITHNDDDMIVSGSFFYAMTIGSKVYCLSTPFFEWVKLEMGEQYIESYLDLEEMILSLEYKACKKETSKLSKKNPEELFGDEVIFKQLKDSLKI